MEIIIIGENTNLGTKATYDTDRLLGDGKQEITKEFSVRKQPEIEKREACLFKCVIIQEILEKLP